MGNLNYEDSSVSRRNQVTLMYFLTMKASGTIISLKANLLKPFLRYMFLFLSELGWLWEEDTKKLRMNSVADNN